MQRMTSTTHSLPAQANCLWAHATLQHRPSKGYLAAISAHVGTCLPAFTPQHISNSVWALATCSHHDQVCSNWPQSRLSLRQCMRPKTLWT